MAYKLVLYRRTGEYRHAIRGLPSLDTFEVKRGLTRMGSDLDKVGERTRVGDYIRIEDDQ